jgi:hypothetical protein
MQMRDVTQHVVLYSISGLSIRANGVQDRGGSLPMMAMTGWAEVRIAPGVKDVGPNGEPQAGTYERIRGPMVVGEEPGSGDRSGCPISKKLHPWFWIFMGNNRRHAPGKHGVAGRK